MPVSERTVDRRVTAAGLWIAGGFLILAVASALLPGPIRRGSWLPLHLAMAGAATESIGAVLPFFTASLLAARPAPARLRWACLALLGAGCLGVTGGTTVDQAALATGGGVAFVAGILLLAAAAFLPLRHALGRRYPWALAAYGVALADVAVGASLATLQLARSAPVSTDWAWLEPAHAWLNLLGFVSLVVAGTLLHLYPTVVGTRIHTGSAARAAVLGLSLGAPLIAVAYLFRSDALGRTGAAVELVGAAALAVHATRLWSSRGRWTRDVDWRSVAIGGLSAGIAWFALGVLMAAGRIELLGATPAAWSFALVAVPLTVGWITQSVLAAWTQLLPALSGGSPERHQTQRSILGRAARLRLLTLNAGAVLLLLGTVSSASPLAAAGATALATAITADLAILLLAARAPEPSA